MTRVTCVLALGLALVGCGSSDEGSAGRTLPISEFPEAFAGAVCDNISGCCDAQSLPYDAQGCRTAISQSIAPFIAEAASANVTWNASAAGACVDQIAATVRQCGDVEAVSVCDGIAHGNLPPGSACTDGRYCSRPPGGSARCDDGVCVQEPRGTAGEPCSTVCQTQGGTTVCTDSPQPGSTHCNEADGLICTLQGTCAPLPSVGEPCPQGYCAAGAYCDLTQTCAAKKADGESCEAFGEECIGACNNGTCGFALAGYCS